MEKNNFFISLGIWLAVLPFLGLPGDWRNALVSLSGIFLLIVVLGPAILKMLKPKPKRGKKPKENNPLNKDEINF